MQRKRRFAGEHTEHEGTHLALLRWAAVTSDSKQLCLPEIPVEHFSSLVGLCNYLGNLKVFWCFHPTPRDTYWIGLGLSLYIWWLYCTVFLASRPRLWNMKMSFNAIFSHGAAFPSAGSFSISCPSSSLLCIHILSHNRNLDKLINYPNTSAVEATLYSSVSISGGFYVKSRISSPCFQLWTLNV